MSAIVLLDTSVYLNVLDVPGRNQQAEMVRQEIADLYARGDTFILPLAAVWETGNHIAHLPDGRQRRGYAQKLVDDVAKALSGQTPYRATHFPARDEFARWIADFPDAAMRNKSPDKTTEGTSLVDLSIIKEWERNCTLHPLRRVRIWSVDSDLTAYDRQR